MNRSYLILFLVVLLLLPGCQSSPQITSEELEQYTIQQTEDEVKDGDFIFRLISEKAEYFADEPVNLYGEIEYIGENKEVTIAHAATAILFPMEEKIRGYQLDSGIQEIGKTTTLKKGVPYRESYIKRTPINFDEDPDYQTFADQFKKGEGFPIGYYKVNGYADFFVKKGDAGEYVKMEANVDFKVLER